MMLSRLFFLAVLVLGCDSISMPGVMRLRGGDANLASYVLLRMGGKESPTIDDMKKVFASVDQELNQVDEVKVQKLLEECNGKEINELIENGRQAFAKVEGEYAAVAGGMGGGGGGGDEGGEAGGGDGGGADAGGAAEAKAEDNADSDEDEDMGFGLFD
mmetsp:Transcript_32278/g.50316  ORF Transcript_32278/g.50316 Transcript_32278/m.50316 type:complete len:159 (+) Transcript_32278:167-643(+)